MHYLNMVLRSFHYYDTGKVINQQPRRSVNSGFPEVSFPPPTSKIHQKPANLQQENAKPLFTAATSSTSESNFANFDVANFRAPSEDKKGKCNGEMFTFRREFDLGGEN